MKIGEYVEFKTESPVVIDKSHYRILPEREYACCVVKVVKRDVDFSIINHWLDEHKIKPEIVLVEEIGFQLFEYFG